MFLSAGMGIAAGSLLAWMVRSWVVWSTRRWPMVGFSAVGGVVSLGVGCRFATDPALPAWWWLGITGTALSVIDVSCRRLPRAWVVTTAAGGFAVFAVLTVTDPANGVALVRSLLAAVVVFAVGVLAYLVIPYWMGFGDVTLYGALALYWGWIGWHAVFRGITASLLLLGITAALAWIRHRDSKARIAAGPSLILGGWIGVLP
ncbi:hypothetical protein [Saccharopolyspora sp. ASAGF58]|uniref:hypothetical protein n=1 Tax=Saccharopolyspora sp. ASAGF58 TaxID=2719023 RepID=UPI00144607BE|nr:hypothetical protein [Saccharopolyspora sp. ASAGF58]